MKKRISIIAIFCVGVCCVLLLFIFGEYYRRSDKTFNQLMYENQEAYAASQRAEVISKVEDVRTTLKTLTTVLEECSSEEEMSKFQSAMSTLGESKDIQAEGVAYFSFSELEGQSIREEEEEIVSKLKSGQSVISNIYETKENESYYGLAEPVRLEGEYVGFVRGLISSETLLYSSQIGFLRDETESYLIHLNGENAFLDYDEVKINMFDLLKDMFDEPEVIDELKEKTKDAEETVIIQTTAEKEAVFVSCSRLPYNDWVILNVATSNRIDEYAEEMEAGGRRAVIATICITAAFIVLILLVYHWSSKEQRFERKRAALIANFSDTVLCEYEIEGDRLNCTSNITKMLLIQDVTVEHFSSYVRENKFIYPDDVKKVERILKDIPKDGKTEEHHMRLKNSEGEYNWYSVHVIALYIKGKSQGRLIMKITDITETKEELMGLMKKTQKDVLTGILNREAFSWKVKEHLSGGGRGYLFMMDLDDFKQINDNCGHQLGDEILKTAADSMKKCFRNEDYVGRYGGDEFLAFMPEPPDENVVKERAKMLVEVISGIRIGEEAGIHLTCSVGVVACEGENYEEFLGEADKAMYRAKKSGRNSWILQ